jgi:integrase
LGVLADAGQEGAWTRKYPLRHLARFILIGLYTGTRSASIAAASPKREEGRSWVDLERGVFYRRQIGRRKTKKRQLPAPIPPRLLAHMRRWHRLGIADEHFVEFNGKPVKSVKTAFASAVEKAGIAHCSPHTLRHTAATWLMQNGAPLWQAAGYLSMSEQTLERVYGHHHTDHYAEAVEAIGRSGKPTVRQ